MHLKQRIETGTSGLTWARAVPKSSISNRELKLGKKKAVAMSLGLKPGISNRELKRSRRRRIKLPTSTHLKQRIETSLCCSASCATVSLSCISNRELKPLQLRQLHLPNGLRHLKQRIETSRKRAVGALRRDLPHLKQRIETLSNTGVVMGSSA